MKKYLILLLILVIACTQVEPTPQLPPGQVNQEGLRSVDVVMENFAFNKPIIKIKVGDTVRWTNKDGVSHTATSDDFDTGYLRSGESKEITFSKPGSYGYICTLHPSMKGKVIVSES